MGILRNKEKCYEPIRIEDLAEDAIQDVYANYIFDSDFADSEHEAEHEPPPKILHRCKKPRSCRRHFGPIETADGLHVKRNMGSQKWRRVENARLIMNYADLDDIYLDGSDLIGETITAFTKLLRDESKMKIWNEFIELDETGQAKMLEKIEKKVALSRTSEKPCSSRKVAAVELRKNHQAHSADACFQRMDRKFRCCFLKRRRLRYEFLFLFEKNLRAFFNDCSTGVYCEDVACRIERFYLHAVAQFLRLKSQTLDGNTSKKMVQVENTENGFKPPDLFLAAFLKKKRQKARKDDDDMLGEDGEKAEFADWTLLH